jgi:NhaP-type Na+/H+ or K+/H+ antiporter
MPTVDPTQLIFGLLVAVVALAWVASRLRVPYPIFLTLGGLAIGLTPGLPRVQLSPDVVFLVFLPPLLYYAGLMTSWRDFRQNLRAISLLAIGLVIFTTCVIAAVAHQVVGMNWPAAFVLGAIISPTDAIAATTITQRLRVPRRIITILEGESLVNDASALIAYRFAVAAVLTGGGFSVAAAGGRFLLAAAGGVAVGYAAGVAMAWIRPRIRDSSVEGLPCSSRTSPTCPPSGCTCRACWRR